MRSTSIIVSMFTLVLFGCEQTVDVDIPYEKKIVINSFVGRSGDDLAWISKTLPVGTTVTPENSVIPDAVVKIRWRDTVYDLIYVPTRRGYTLPQFDERWYGDSLTMTVDWEGLHAEATAKVPLKPKNYKAYWYPNAYDSSYGVLSESILVPNGVVAWFDEGDFQPSVFSPMQFYTYYYPIDPDNSRVEYIGINYNGVNMSREAVIEMDSATLHGWVSDIEYERYLREPYTRSEEPFGFGGRNPYFNVKGDGLGLFIPVVEINETVKIEIN